MLVFTHMAVPIASIGIMLHVGLHMFLVFVASADIHFKWMTRDCVFTALAHVARAFTFLQ